MRRSRDDVESAKRLVANNKKKKKPLSRRALAREAKVSASALNEWVWNEERLGVFGPRWYKGDPPKIEQYGYYIKGLIEKDYRISLEAIADALFTEYGYDCSTTTVANFLKREGIPSCKKRRKAGGWLKGEDDVGSPREPLAAGNDPDHSTAPSPSGDEADISPAPLESETDANEDSEPDFAALAEGYEQFERKCADVNDGRDGNRKQYTLAQLLFIACLAILCKYSTLKDFARFAAEKEAFLNRVVDLPGLPDKTTFQRAFKRLDPDTVRWLLLGGARVMAGDEMKAVAVDGKKMKATASQVRDRSCLGLVLAVDHRTKLVVAAKVYGQGVGEITAVQSLINSMNRTGLWFTFDALHLQINTTEKILDGGGKFCISVKDNQKEVRKILSQVIRKRKYKFDGEHTEEDDSHGRNTIRTYRIWKLTRKERNSICIPGAAMVATCETLTEERGWESRTYLLSEEVPVEIAASLIGKHWGVESKNWEADNLYHEDQHQVHDPNVAAVLALLRRYGLNTASTSDVEPTTKGVLHRAAMNDRVLTKVFLHSLSLLGSTTTAVTA